MPFPKAGERKKCWDSKDAYWECMDRTNNDKSKCTAERAVYEESCIKQWVSYWDKRRDYLKYKTKLESGENPGPSPNQPT